MEVLRYSPSTKAERSQFDALPEDEQLAEALEKLVITAEHKPPRHAPADFEDITLVAELDPSFVPQPLPEDGEAESSTGVKRRLVVVGDIHGMKAELEHLLHKMKFDKERDHLVCAGDMINKGPDSVGVVDLLMSLGASAVRGNHEDRILLAWKAMHSKSTPLIPQSALTADAVVDEDVVEEESNKSKKNQDRHLAKQLSKAQIKWLQKLPVILKVGEVKGLGSVVVVHGGIVPGVQLERQDPYTVMNMRTIDLKTREPSENHKGSVWTKLYNKFQHHLPKSERMTVIYGHDSRRGLSIEDFTKGVDTGCLKGGKLTAFVIEGGKNHIETSLVSVKCRDKS